MTSARLQVSFFESDELCCPPVSQRGTRGRMVVTAGPCPGRVIPFLHQGLPLSMGRGPECAVRFESDSVSPLHANAVWIGDKHFITDAGSTHGTYVNNQLADVATQLQPGDRIHLGPEIAMAFELVHAQQETALDAGVPSVRDPVTGMYQGSFLEQALDRELRKARSRGSQLSLMLIRIDQLQSLQMSLGRAARDELVSAVMCALASWTRESDTIGHHDDDLLMVIAPDTSLAYARAMAERLRRDVAETPLTWQSQTLKISLSIGVASMACCGPQPGVRRMLEVALERTDMAWCSRNAVVASGGRAPLSRSARR